MKEKGQSGSNYQTDLCKMGYFCSFTHLWHSGPFQWKPNATEKTNITLRQMRRGSDISHFWFHSCSRPCRNPPMISTPIRYLKRRRARHSCLCRWQLPWGTLTVRGHYFSLKSSPCWDLLLWKSENSLNQQRMKCWGLPVKTTGDSEAKWTVDMLTRYRKTQCVGRIRQKEINWNIFNTSKCQYLVHIYLFLRRRSRQTDKDLVRPEEEFWVWIKLNQASVCS